MTKIPQHKYPQPLISVIEKLYPAGRSQFIRFCQGETVHYALDLLPEYAGHQLSTMGNLPQGVPKISDQGTTYPSIDLGHCPPGHYHFKALISNGTDHKFDSSGYTHVLVDPARTNNIRLYTFIPTISGGLEDWMEDFERIAKLGFNMVHFLPITPMDQSESPYSASSFFGVDPNYLKKGGATLKDLVRKAQELKLGLCFDLVLNHVGFTSEMAKGCPEWIQSDPQRTDGLKRAGCWADRGWLTWEDLVLIHYDHPDATIRQEIWDYMLEVILYWADLANSTGGMIRLDNLHSTNPQFLTWAMEKLHQKYPEVIVLGELFTSPEEQKRMVLEHQIHLLLATPWDKRFVPDLRALLEYIHQSFPQMKFILPISSHDSGTPTQEFYDVRATLPRYAVSALLNCGSMGMCQGVEFGAPSKLEFIGLKPKQTIEGPIDFHDDIRELNALMDQYSALRQGGNLTMIDNGHGAILGAYRHSLDENCPHLVVLINMDLHHEQSILVQSDAKSLFSTDQLKLIYGETFETLVDLPAQIKLPPCGVRVYEVLR